MSILISRKRIGHFRFHGLSQSKCLSCLNRWYFPAISQNIQLTSSSKMSETIALYWGQAPNPQYCHSFSIKMVNSELWLVNFAGNPSMTIKWKQGSHMELDKITATHVYQNSAKHFSYHHIVNKQFHFVTWAHLRSWNILLQVPFLSIYSCMTVIT